MRLLQQKHFVLFNKINSWVRKFICRCNSTHEDPCIAATPLRVKNPNAAIAEKTILADANEEAEEDAEGGASIQ